MNYYITGDCHRDFSKIIELTNKKQTTIEDVCIILGDVGINYYLDDSDNALKEELSKLNITLFCIHGNHEERPYECGDYEIVKWKEGMVYVEKEYPNLIFAKDGEIYNFNENKVVVMGGAYSVDKYYRLQNNMNWFETEQPDANIKNYVVSQLDKHDWKVDIVLTHTVPYLAEPTWAFLPGIDQSKVDKTTENFLQEIYMNLSFSKWYAGHYHVDSEEEDIRILYHRIELLF